MRITIECKYFRKEYWVSWTGHTVRKWRERPTKVPGYLIERGRSSGGLCAQLRRQHRPWTRTLNEWRNEASRYAVLCPLHSFMDWASALTREWRERMTGKLGQVGSAYSGEGSSCAPYLSAFLSDIWVEEAGLSYTAGQGAALANLSGRPL